MALNGGGCCLPLFTLPASREEQLCNGTMSLLFVFFLSVPSIESSSDVQLLMSLVLLSLTHVLMR